MRYKKRMVRATTAVFGLFATPFIDVLLVRLALNRIGQGQPNSPDGLSLFLAVCSVRSLVVCCTLDETCDFGGMREHNDMAGRNRDRFRLHFLRLAFLKLR